MTLDAHVTGIWCGHIGGGGGVWVILGNPHILSSSPICEASILTLILALIHLSGGFPTLLGLPYNKDYSSLASILGSP